MITVEVGPLPAWLDHRRLLGDAFHRDGDTATAQLDRSAAADVAARLRGLGFDGAPVVVRTRPRLSRPVVRAGRTRDARARRERTPGFERAGTRLDEEGRYSLTPERLAVALATPFKDQAVLDLCCGCGGNAIAFARAGCAVTAVERDRERLGLAEHNARIYGVVDRIRFVHGNGLDHLGDGLVFVDPPWGTDWSRTATHLSDLPLLHEVVRRHDGPMLAKVPSSFVTTELPGFTPRAWFGAAAGDRHRVKFLSLRR